MNFAKEIMQLKQEANETGNWKNVELQILDSDCNNTRTFLRVNEKLRLAILQVYYAKANITTKENLVHIPQKYIPATSKVNDLNWFVGGHSNRRNSNRKIYNC